MNQTKKPRSARKPAPWKASETNPAPSGIADALRAAMKDSGLSSYRMAADSGVNIAAILRFLSGEASLTLPSVDRLAALLGLELVPRKRK